MVLLVCARVCVSVCVSACAFSNGPFAKDFDVGSCSCLICRAIRRETTTVVLFHTDVKPLVYYSVVKLFCIVKSECSPFVLALSTSSFSAEVRTDGHVCQNAVVG